MPDSPDRFAHRNRLRIVVLVVLATSNDVIAVVLAAVAATLAVIVATLMNLAGLTGEQ